MQHSEPIGGDQPPSSLIQVTWDPDHVLALIADLRLALIISGIILGVVYILRALVRNAQVAAAIAHLLATVSRFVSGPLTRSWNLRATVKYAKKIHKAHIDVYYIELAHKADDPNRKITARPHPVTERQPSKAPNVTSIASRNQ